MEFSSTLNDVVRNLQNDVNNARIKKLMLFACQGIWENDANRLDNIDLHRLVQDLVAVTNTLETLESVINSIASKLNKKTEYAIVANIIVNQVGRLYPRYDEPTVAESSLSNLLSQPESSVGKETNFQPQNPDERARYEYNLLSSKMKILQQTNPLRAKIILFSAIYHVFTFSDRDWLFLKNKSLEDLLQRVFTICNSPSEVKQKLSQVVGSFQDREEYSQTIATIIQSLNQCYERLKQENDLIQTADQNINYSSPKQSHTILENNSANSNYDLDATALRSEIYPHNGIIGNETIIESQAFPQEGEEYSPHLHLWPEVSGNKAQDFSKIIPRSEITEGTATEALDVNNREMDVESTAAFIPKTPLANSNNFANSRKDFKFSDAIKQKLNLEEQIKSLITDTSRSMLEVMENNLRRLEKDLEETLGREQPDTRIVQKYQGLRDFLGEVQSTVGELLEVINELEAKEKLTIKPAHSPTGETTKDQSESGTSSTTTNREKVIHIARQGNPKAIAALLNQILKSHGIIATAIVKDICLQIILEAAEVPEQKNVVNLVEKHLQKWQLLSIKIVKLYGRKTGNKAPSWVQEITYK